MRTYRSAAYDFAKEQKSRSTAAVELEPSSVCTATSTDTPCATFETVKTSQGPRVSMQISNFERDARLKRRAEGEAAVISKSVEASKPEVVDTEMFPDEIS